MIRRSSSIVNAEYGDDKKVVWGGINNREIASLWPQEIYLTITASQTDHALRGTGSIERK